MSTPSANLPLRDGNLLATSILIKTATPFNKVDIIFQVFLAEVGNLVSHHKITTVIQVMDSVSYNHPTLRSEQPRKRDDRIENLATPLAMTCIIHTVSGS